ncbi:MAG: PHP domain-containing protein [Treponema sp.]|nr:PHP domain-containing protein [Treponema sp.]
MIDLHTHSSASDGSLTPSQLMDEAAHRGLSAIALTDHDTIDGLAAASTAAQKWGIQLIPGIEIEIRWEPGEFHLLGLGLGHLQASFLAGIAELSRLREKRNREILDRMHALSIQADYEDIRALSGGRLVGRPHFATFLVNRGFVKNREQAFFRYLGKGKPLYVPKEGLEFEKALDLIKQAGGIAVLAHPMSLYIAWGHLPGLIKNLRDRGLDGIEAWHPTAKVRSCKRLEELGTSLGLYITAGSDFHGASRPDRKLGITAGDRKIEDAILEAIPVLACR